MTFSRQQLRAQARAQAFQEVTAKYGLEPRRARRRIALRLAKTSWRELSAAVASRARGIALAVSVLAAVAGWIGPGAGKAWAQGTRKDDIVLNARGTPQAGATVAVCTQPAVTTTTPCSPLANLFSNPQLTQALVNPLTTDGLGNYTFYASPGKYTIQIYGPSITTKVLPDVVLPNDPSAPSFTTVTTTSGISAFSLTLTGNLTVNGSASVSLGFGAATLTIANQGTPPGTPAAGNVVLYTKTDKKFYQKDDTGTESLVGTPAVGSLVFASVQAGATADLKIQAAINALPATGGTVVVDLLGAQTIASDVFSAVTKNVHLVWSNGQYTFSVNTTFPTPDFFGLAGGASSTTGITNEIWNGAQWLIPNGVTVFVKSAIIAGNYQIFSLTGTGVVNPLQGERGTGRQNIMWWGATPARVTALGVANVDSTAAFLAAINAAIIAGVGTVYVPAVSNMNDIPTGQVHAFVVGATNTGGAGSTVTLPTTTNSRAVVIELAGILQNRANATIGFEVGNNAYSFVGVGSSGDNIGGQQSLPQVQLTGSGTIGLPNPLVHVGQTASFSAYNVAFLSPGKAITFDGPVQVRIKNTSYKFTGNNLADPLWQINTIAGSTTFNWGIEDSTWQSTNDPASKSAIQVTNPSSGSGWRYVTMKNCNFNFRAITVDDGTLGGGGLFAAWFENILFESNREAFLNLTGNTGSKGHFILNHVIMADAVVGAPIISITNGTSLQDVTIVNSSPGLPTQPLINSTGPCYGIKVDDNQAAVALAVQSAADSSGQQSTWRIREKLQPAKNLNNLGALTTYLTEYNELVSGGKAGSYFIPMDTPTGVAGALQAGGSLTVGQTYFYAITALDALGWETILSAFSTSVTPTSGNQKINVTWNTVAGAVKYHVYRSLTGAAGSQGILNLAGTVQEPTTNSFLDDGTFTQTAQNAPALTTAAKARVGNDGTLYGLKLNLTTGVAADSGGIKHKRVAACTTGAAQFSTCTTTVTWTTPYADANYTCAAAMDNPTGVPWVLGTSSKAAGSIGVSIANLTAVAASGTINIVCMHD